ncbi:MAG: ATP-binding cassette domain-containing protein [Thermodesulfobacteriota bacterium]
MQGAVMGISRKEMKERFDQIADFADIGVFIDQSVKTYSSGMYVRLAFAVAINVDPDILIVDEVLAVGDAMFQRRCYRKLEEFHKQRKTIVFVSHSLGTHKYL